MTSHTESVDITKRNLTLITSLLDRKGLNRDVASLQRKAHNSWIQPIIEHKCIKIIGGWYEWGSPFEIIFCSTTTTKIRL